jgi:RND family efflux transporter MFP subunit
MVKSAVIVTVLLILQIGFTSCSNNATPEIVTNAVRVSVRRVGSSDAPQQYAFSGNIEGKHKVTLSTKIMGQITSMPYDAGTRVSAGQVVVRINSDDLRAKRAQIKASALEAQAAFKNAEVNYERMKNLYAKKSASQKELDDLETMYQMASAKKNAVKEMENEINDAIGYGELRSPFDGFIVAKMAQQGDIASPGMPLLVIEDLSVLKIIVSVPESEIHLLKQKDKVLVRVGSVENDLAGQVEQINPSGNPMSRQFDVKVALTGMDNMQIANVKSGMYAQVILEKGTAKTITVPQSIIVKRGQLEGVFIMSDGGTAMLRWIRTGNSSGKEVEVLSGLRDGERLILSNTMPLKDGQKVEVMN